jgi:hypothetical protein
MIPHYDFSKISRELTVIPRYRAGSEPTLTQVRVGVDGIMPNAVHRLLAFLLFQDLNGTGICRALGDSHVVGQRKGAVISDLGEHPNSIVVVGVGNNNGLDERNRPDVDELPMQRPTHGLHFSPEEAALFVPFVLNSRHTLSCDIMPSLLLYVQQFFKLSAYNAKTQF